MYFFLEKNAVPAVLSDWDKPVILEQVTLEKKGLFPAAEDWAVVGFQPYLQRKRLFLSAKNTETKGREIAFCKETDVDEILRLMQEAFEPYTSALPERKALLADLRNDRVIAAKENGRLIGFLRFGREKRVSVLWQIVVSPEGRGKGIGKRLVRDWLALEREFVSKFQLWVREDNPAALQMYEKLGFLPDGRIAPVMIKK